MEIRNIATWVLIGIIIGLAGYLIFWVHSESFKCMSNPYNYSLSLLQESNHAQVTCLCYMNKTNSFPIQWDSSGFHQLTADNFK